MPDGARRGKLRQASFSAVLSVAVSGITIVACGSESEPSPPSPPAPPPSTEHIATAADFDGFRSWERIALETPTVHTKARPGPVAVYVSRRPEPGARSFPVGTVLVKAVESGDDPRDWTVHAMVKRGPDFNAHGAVGWEFFGLQLTADGRPVILWRSEGDNDGHSYSSGLSPAPVAGRAPGAELTCIDCHAAAWQDDSVLTPALSLRASR